MIAAEQALALKPDAMRRLAALAVATVEDGERLTGRLRLSNAEALQLDSMAHRWWRLGALDEAQARVRLYKLGAQRFRDRAMLGWARDGARDDYWRNLVTLDKRWPVPVFPLKAANFIARGMQPGPALGEALNRAEQVWIDAGFPAGDSELSAIADRIRKELSA